MHFFKALLIVAVAACASDPGLTGGAPADAGPQADLVPFVAEDGKRLFQAASIEGSDTQPWSGPNVLEPMESYNIDYVLTPTAEEVPGGLAPRVVVSLESPGVLPIRKVRYQLRDVAFSVISQSGEPGAYSQQLVLMPNRAQAEKWKDRDARLFLKGKQGQVMVVLPSENWRQFMAAVEARGIAADWASQ